MRDLLDLLTQLQNGNHNPWKDIVNFYNSKGFVGIAAGAIQKSSGQIAGIFVDCPDNWQEEYKNQNYIDIDPWAKKLLTARDCFIYDFEKRDEHFRNKDDAVETMLCDMHENGLSHSVLMPTFKSGDFLIALNLWSGESGEEFAQNLQHNLPSLKLESIIITAFLKQLIENGANQLENNGWILNPEFANPLSMREQEVLKWL